jgi:hypothetical protein
MSAPAEGCQLGLGSADLHGFHDCRASAMSWASVNACGGPLDPDVSLPRCRHEAGAQAARLMVGRRPRAAPATGWPPAAPFLKRRPLNRSHSASTSDAVAAVSTAITATSSRWHASRNGTNSARSPIAEMTRRPP